MKKLRILMLALLLPVFVMTGCDTGGDGPTDGEAQIELPNADEKEQQAFADDETTGGFTFTAKQSWTATVTENTTRAGEGLDSATRASGVDWLRLLFDGEETYSGAAGSFTLVIELDENYSGETRTATITIKSGNDTITITVTQDGKTEDGTVPVEPDPSGEIGVPVAGSRLVSKIVMSGGQEGTVDFTYDNKNRLVKMEIVSMIEPDGDGEPYSQNIDVTFDYSLIGTGVFKTTYSQSSEYSSLSQGSTYTLGANGYLTSGTVEYIEHEDGGGTYTGTEEWAGTYNSNGYLTKSVFGGDADFFYDVTWTGGNLTKLYSGEGEAQTDFEYSTVANNPKCNLDLNWVVSGDDFVDTFAAMVGLFGKRSANMISKETLTYPTDDHGHTLLFSYETDSQGFITKITMDDGGIENSVMTVTYR